jgi:branched-chain amino acid transport system substrate-binding protein
VFLLLLAPGAHAQRKAPDSSTLKGDPIKVGVFADMSGRTSMFGSATARGVKLAAEEINRAGGIDGRPVKIVVADDQGLPSGAVTSVKELIQDDRVDALIGEVASSNSLAAAPWAQEAQVPMISPSSTNPKVTQVGSYIFRTAFVDPRQGWAMARFARQTLRAKTAAILGDVNSTYSQGMTKSFSNEFRRRGGRIVALQFYTQDDVEFQNQVRALRRSRPDVIYLPGYYPQAGAIAKEARRLGMQQPILGGDGWDSPRLFEIAGSALSNTYMSNHYAEDDPSLVVRDFATRYAARYGEPPDSLAALAYDTMNLLADALRRARTTESEKLRDAIAQTRNFHGVTGDLTLDTDRNAIKPVIILQYRDGKYVYRDRVVP